MRGNVECPVLHGTVIHRHAMPYCLHYECCRCSDHFTTDTRGVPSPLIKTVAVTGCQRRWLYRGDRTVTKNRYHHPYWTATTRVLPTQNRYYHPSLEKVDPAPCCNPVHGLHQPGSRDNAWRHSSTRSTPPRSSKVGSRRTTRYHLVCP